LVVLAILPGLPALPFLVLGAAAGGLAWHGARRQTGEEAKAEALAPPGGGQEEPITTALAMDPVRLELGYGLLSLIGDDRGQRLPHQIKALRRQLAAELGFVMPSVRIQDNIQLPANTYVVRLKEIEAGRGEIRAGMLLVMDPQGRPITLPGEGTTEPTFGLAATWVVPGLRDEAMLMGLTVVDPATVITTHLTELVRDNLADLLTYAETQKLLGDLPAEYQKLMGELVPARITTAGIQRVLQGLLGERVSIRDLPRILEAIAEALAVTQSTMLITEHVRARLARQITTACTGESGLVPIITLSPAWEQAFAAALTGHGDERQLAMAPSELQRFVREV
jgi:flagellar biosynthesis protein FlhA